MSPVAADRVHEEFTEHAERLAAAGCELILARGQGSRLGLMAAVVAASRTELPTWAVLEYGAHDELTSTGNASALVEALANAGARVVLFEVPQVAPRPGLPGAIPRGIRASRRHFLGYSSRPVSRACAVFMTKAPTPSTGSNAPWTSASAARA